MNVYETLAIAGAIILGVFILLSLIGNEDNPSHFESWRKKYHERKLTAAKYTQELEKYKLDYDVRMEELAVERLKLQIKQELKDISNINFETKNENN